MKRLIGLTFLLSTVLGWIALFFLIHISIEHNENGIYCNLSDLQNANWSFQGNPCVLKLSTIIQDFSLGIIIFPVCIFVIFLPLVFLFISLIKSFINFSKFGKGKS